MDDFSGYSLSTTINDDKLIIWTHNKIVNEPVDLVQVADTFLNSMMDVLTLLHDRIISVDNIGDTSETECLITSIKYELYDESLTTALIKHFLPKIFSVRNELMNKLYKFKYMLVSLKYIRSSNNVLGTYFVETVTHKNIEGSCTCVAMSAEYLHSIIYRLPKDLDIDTFINDVLPIQYGLVISPSTRSMVEDIWSVRWHDMANIMEDGVPAVLHVQTASARWAIRAPTYIESLMQDISKVACLDNVCHVTKWNKLYRHE